jgi:MinD-like ATPase involved in chromosome partitioning or flagellar assembly
MEKSSVPAAQEREKMDKQRLFPHVIAITSGKGGVGKSSIAVNLGISLAKTGARVCIFDADTGLANVNILLGLAPQFSLEHVLFGAKTIEEVMLEAPHGLKVIPGANGISECVSLHPRQQLRLTRELGRIESEFDYLLLDTAAGIADTTLDFVSSAHQTMVVVTPEPTSLTDAFSLIKLMHRRRTAMNYQVVVNMCSNVAQAREVFHRFAAAVEKYIGVRPNFLGHLLRDESLRVAVTLQSPVALFPESDPSSRSFMRLTDAIKQAVDGQHPTIGFTGFWQRQFRQRQTADNAGRTAPPVADKLGEQNKPDQIEPATLIELQQQLLQQIQNRQVPQAELTATLELLNRGYMKRFAQLPIEPLAAIEALIALPERNDHLLRELATRLKPWRNDMQNLDVPLVDELPASHESEPPVLHAATPNNAIDGDHNSRLDNTDAAINDADIVASNSGDAANNIATTTDEVVTATVVEAPAAVASRTPMPHRYDERRFGSQQALLELLQRQRESGKSAMALIEIMLT